ncbi:MAG: porin [Massilia sp.]|nr:porin [Massilia sp.]
MKPSVLVVALAGVLFGAGSACADGGAGIYSVQGAGADSERPGQRGVWLGGQSYVGWTSSSGAVTVGRPYHLDFLVGNLDGNLDANFGRPAGNAITAYSAQANGVPAGASYDAGERARDPAANRVWGLSVGFERGPLTIRAAHQNRNAAPVAPATPMGNNMDAKNSILAANLRVGSATAYAAYSANRGWGSSPLFNPDNPYSASMASTASTDSRDVLVGLALPCGPTTLLASYVRKNDRDLSNRDASQLALGASYTVSRRTDFYASYSRIENRNDAGNAGPRGAATSALNLGMRHGF